MIELENWKTATNALTIYFIEKYFKDKDWYPEWFWISDEIGDVLVISDYFFSVTDIASFIEYKYSKDKMFEYYWYAMKCYEDKEVRINIKNYKKLKTL
jgi:hypothetical protein